MDEFEDSSGSDDYVMSDEMVDTDVYDSGEYDDDIDEDPDYSPSNYTEDQITQSLADTVESSAHHVNENESHTPPIQVENEAEPDRQPSADAVPSPSASSSSSQQNIQASGPAEAQEILPKSQKRSPEVRDRSILASQGGSADEVCTICFEPWTTSGEHRLVSLKCGHLFGRSCIFQWLSGQNARCPQCNTKARKTDVRNIYARALKVLDSSERDKALQDLMKETQLRRAAEMEAAQERMRHCLAVQECEKLKRELMEAQRQLQEYRSAGLKRSKMSEVSASQPAAFSLMENIQIIKDGGCRIVNSGDLLGMLLVSQPSSNGLFPGFGFRKISTMTMKPCDFVLVHKKLIRDMAFHNYDGLVLTASVDKTLKITNVLSNTVVQTYDLESDVWSCAWDADNSTYFYGGLKTGEVFVFDIRVTNRYVCELPRFGTKTPVVSLQYLPKPSFYRSSGGPVVGKLSDCALHMKTEIEGNYNLVPMPALGPFTCLSVGDSGNALVSCRPSPKQPRISHTFCDFVTTPTGELTCVPIKTVFGGRTQVQLTRSKLFSHPNNASSALICAGDEDGNGALIWDASSGDVIDNLRTESPVLDFAALKLNQKFYLTSLTSKSLQIYDWNQR